MKKHLSKIIILALVIGVSTAFVKANISYDALTPISYFEVDFDFQIGSKSFSKGRYRLSKDRQYVLILENLDESETKVILGTVSSKSSFAKNQSTLRFNRYGDKYFLRKIMSPTISAKLNFSKAEKKARKNYGKKLAKVRVKSD